MTHPRRNIKRKLRANKRMRKYHRAKAWRVALELTVKAVGEAVSIYNAARDKWNHDHPLPSSFKSGGLAVMGLGAEPVITFPLRARFSGISDNIGIIHNRVEVDREKIGASIDKLIEHFRVRDRSGKPGGEAEDL
jgi:hypothetical protein